MQEAPLPQDDDLRVQDLLSHHILDSSEAQSYNELFRLLPGAYFIGRQKQQWFKSTINLDAEQVHEAVQLQLYHITGDYALRTAALKNV